MKSDLTKVSIALLCAVSILGCQDLGPVGPDGLVPQFTHRPGTCKGHHKNDPGCEPDPPADRPLYTVTMAGGLGDFSGTTIPVRGESVIVSEVVADLTFFMGKVTCGLANLDDSATGSLTILAGDDHLHVFFQFLHNAAKHTITLESTKPDPWPPTAAGDLEDLNGEWALETRGKNNKDGCTGAGEDGNDPIGWTATVTLN